MDTYLFSDMGILAGKINATNYLSAFNIDAGIGSALTVKWGIFNINPLVIRFDVPFYLNNPPAGTNNFDRRFVLGINRSF